MDQQAKYRVNPSIVLREEFDDWAVLFDPDTGDAHGLDPVGVFIWQRLDGTRTAEEILAALGTACEDVPTDAPAHLEAFLDELLGKGYIADA
jgi:SynChlorMet cassette protein ScmD